MSVWLHLVCNHINDTSGLIFWRVYTAVKQTGIWFWVSHHRMVNLKLLQKSFFCCWNILGKTVKLVTIKRNSLALCLKKTTHTDTFWTSDPSPWPACVDFLLAFLMSSSILVLSLISSCCVFTSSSFCLSARALRACQKKNVWKKFGQRIWESL